MDTITVRFRFLHYSPRNRKFPISKCNCMNCQTICIRKWDLNIGFIPIRPLVLVVSDLSGSRADAGAALALLFLLILVTYM